MNSKTRTPRRSAQAARRTDGAARTSTEVEASGAAPGNAWNALTELGQQHLTASAEAVAVLLRGSEALRRIQQQAAHHASLRHREAVQKLQASRDPFDLIAVPSELLRVDMEETLRCWQELSQSTLQTQVEMVGCVSTLFRRSGADGASGLPGAGQPSAAPSESGDGTKDGAG